ncbi:MAG TPA: hypothetical protein VFH10_15675 [Nocardioides sp.]|uniref:hypothetical protein n=1 Tax=Nocardioides sp. TaxID=35761 RepID=UPI002D7E393C|nr:hypothetical protein [Nocardioides sp.]HET6654077.1 hypothetical protein [Nocardioides sp.]
MDVDNDQQPGDHDVLQQGPAERGRLETWAASRQVRLTAIAAVGVVATGWFLLGPGLSGTAGSRAPADVGVLTADTGTDGDAPDAPVIEPRERDHECESEGQSGDARSTQAKGDADRSSRALAKTMRRFAEDPGAAAGVRWAPRVVVLGEGPVDVNRTVGARQANRSATWNDPSYLLSRLAVAKPAQLRVDDQRHVTCRGLPREQAAGFEGRDWVSVQPRVRDDGCRRWWAVDLYLDGSGRVEAVLVRS